MSIMEYFVQKQPTGRKPDSPIWDYFIYLPLIKKSRCTICFEEGSQQSQDLSGKNATNLKTHLSSKHKLQYAEFVEKVKRRRLERDLTPLNDSATSESNDPMRIKLEVGELEPCDGTIIPIIGGGGGRGIKRRWSDEGEAREELMMTCSGEEGLMMIDRLLEEDSNVNGGGNEEVDDDEEEVLMNNESIEKSFRIMLIRTGISFFEENHFKEFFRSLNFQMPSLVKIYEDLKIDYNKSAALLKNMISETSVVMVTVDVCSKRSSRKALVAMSVGFFARNERKSVHAMLNVYQMKRPVTSVAVNDRLDATLATWEIPTRKVVMVIVDSNGMHLAEEIKRCVNFKNEESENETFLLNFEDEGRIDDEEFKVEMSNIKRSLNFNSFSSIVEGIEFILDSLDRHEGFVALMTKLTNLSKEIKDLPKRFYDEMNLSVMSWKSNFFRMTCILERRDTIFIEEFTSYDWERLEETQLLIKPFVESFVYLVNEDLILPQILPFLLNLECHLVRSFSGVAQFLLKSFREYFGFVLRSADSNFSSIAAAACLLDPFHLSIISTTNTKQLLDAAKEYIKIQVSSERQLPAVGMKNLSMFKKFPHLAKKLSTEDVDSEMNKYITECLVTPILNRNSVEFWLEKEKTYPNITKFALQIATLPASQAFKERIFAFYEDLKMNETTILTENEKAFLRINKIVYN